MKPTASVVEQLLAVRDNAIKAHHRRAIWLQGSDAFCDAVLAGYANALPQTETLVCLGRPLSNRWQVLKPAAGKSLLGQQIHALVFDCSTGFDASSFAAALGALTGGGLLFIRYPTQEQLLPFQQWLMQHFKQLLHLSEQGLQPHNWSQWMADTCYQSIVNPPSNANLYITDDQRPPRQSSVPFVQPSPTADQQTAIDKIAHQISGHRRRPLLITADRGRGKTAALGMGVAHLLEKYQLHGNRQLFILLTAPHISAVQPLWQHAIDCLQPLGSVRKQQHQLLFNDRVVVKFVAPDEVSCQTIVPDLLIVDEAAAIPLPLIYAWLAQYHRTVFSTTIDGYEGSGQGFSLKLAPWLDRHRPGWQACRLQVPVRWAIGDPLEKWLLKMLVLRAIPPAPLTSLEPDRWRLQLQPVVQLIRQPQILEQAFALLLNAHYQTSPNDLLRLISDPQHRLYLAYQQKQLIACIWLSEEGSLTTEQAIHIQQGKRLPRGQLVAGGLTHYFSCSKFAQFRSVRILRIAVHPQCQGKGIGTFCIQQLHQALAGDLAVTEPNLDFISTSFGLTAELYAFWCQQGYQQVKLASKADHASGCYSIAMLRPISERGQALIEQTHQQWRAQLWYLARETFYLLDPMLLFLLLKSQQPARCWRSSNILTHYAAGGSSYEAAYAEFCRYLVAGLANTHIPIADHALVLTKLIQGRDWQQTAQLFQLTGRKQVEQRLRQYVSQQLGACHHDQQA